MYTTVRQYDRKRAARQSCDIVRHQCNVITDANTAVQDLLISVDPDPEEVTKAINRVSRAASNAQQMVNVFKTLTLAWQNGEPKAEPVVEDEPVPMKSPEPTTTKTVTTDDDIPF